METESTYWFNDRFGVCEGLFMVVVGGRKQRESIIKLINIFMIDRSHQKW